MSSAFRYKPGTIVRSLKSTVTVSSGDKSYEVIALWDTGATSCCVSEDVVEKLSLIATGKIKMSTTSSECEQADTYMVDLLLPNDILIKDVVVANSKIGAQGIGLLVGMDIITRGDFLITNNRETVFSFRMPSEGTADFVSGIRMLNTIKSNKKSSNKFKPKRKK